MKENFCDVPDLYDVFFNADITKNYEVNIWLQVHELIIDFYGIGVWNQLKSTNSVNSTFLSSFKCNNDHVSSMQS